MMSGDQVAGLIFLAMAAVLVTANLRGWQLPVSRMVTMGLVWVLIIVALTLIFTRIESHLPGRG